MDTRPHERERQALHEVVSTPAPRRAGRAAPRPNNPAPLARVAKPALVLLVALSLVSAVVGGLVRAGAAGATLPTQAWAGQAAALHAALMISGFLGTVIAIERAVAVQRRWAFLGPLLSGTATVLLLGGQLPLGAGLGVVAAVLFVAVNLLVLQRQRATHTALLLVGALAWLTGNVMFASGRPLVATLPWWWAFPVLTIAAERLEMTRLTRRHPAANPVLLVVLAMLLLGAAWSGFDALAGGTLYGLALVALAVWLGLFDIARRTVLAHGLSRYMAVCLLLGYAWLGLAGQAWWGTAWGCPGRDLALHALGLGFIISMVMGHAPVILPAVAWVKLLFGPWFYAPLALLHGSLALRVFGGVAHPAWRSAGAALNVAAIALFAAVVLGSALAWRLGQHRTQ